MTKILIVDDHPLVRTGFAQLIGDCPDLEVCGEAGDMADALKQIDACVPDLAIIDLSLAGGSGLDLIQHIKSRDRGILMLVASMHDETLYAQENIIPAIRQVLSGKVFLSQHMTDRLLSGMVDANGEKRDIDSLSNRELQVFELIGQGATASQMAEQLNLSVKTIETHQAHIKRKLGLGSAHELIQRAIRWVMDEGS
jgi:DNA-binding NarL/FixJ family response regulator